MMSWLFTAAAFIVALGVLVTFHELGHYAIARLCGVKVLRFSVGFGQPLWIKKLGRDQTEWAIGAIPLGGYVKMLDEREADVALAERHRAFNRQSVWRRFAIVVAGPLANFILAIAVYSALFIYGVQELVPIVTEPPAKTAAADAGLARGDKILRINGEDVASWQDVRLRILQFALAKAPVRLEVVNRKREISWHALDVSRLNADDLDGDILRHLGMQLYPPEIPPVIFNVTPGGVAERAGLLTGDRVRSINDQPVQWWDQVVGKIRQSPGIALDMEIERNGQIVDITVKPEASGEENARVGRIGAAPYFDAETMHYSTIEIRYGVLEACPGPSKKPGTPAYSA